MNKECKITFDRLNQLIEKRRDSIEETLLNVNDNKKPEVHALSSGILFQFFYDWIEDIKFDENDVEIKKSMKPIKLINDNKNFNGIELSFVKKNTVKNYIPKTDELFIMLDGCTDFNFHDSNDNENIVLNPFSAVLLKKDSVIDIIGKCEVNYYIKIEFNSPLS